MTEWIRVEDDLPTEEIPCWVVYPWRIDEARGFGWAIAWRKDGLWETVEGIVVQRITHWAYADVPTTAPDGLPFGRRP